MYFVGKRRRERERGYGRVDTARVATRIEYCLVSLVGDAHPIALDDWLNGFTFAI